MRKIISTLLLFCIIATTATAQLVSNNAFLQGRYVEVGVSPCGSFGSSVCAPGTYHPRGTGNASASCQIGFLANPAKDNWANFVGDYFLPGSPEEGWGLSINGSNFNNNLICNVSDISGSFINYSTNAIQSSATWQGNVAGLSITARTYIPINSIYFVTEVTVVNTSASTINNVFYMRNVDPDHGVLTPSAGGSFRTNNVIVSQTPNTCSQSLVSATTELGNFYLGLGSIDSRARVAMGNFSNRSASDIWNAPASGGGLVSSGTRNSVDEAISISFNLGSLAPNQTTKFAYTYILDANQLSEALAATNINMNVNGVLYNTGSSVDICSNAPIPIAITNAGGFTNWTWSPTTGLSPSTGTNVVATLTGPITYTATGTGTCGSVSVDITLNPQVLTPPGNATTITAPSIVTFGQTGVVLSVPPVINATSYFWELPPGTVVTSASNSTSTITISFSNTAWCGKIKVYPINACASGSPALKDICITNIFTGNVRTNICAGDTLSVPFSIQGGGSFIPGNTFTAQLSDTLGNFETPTNIGSVNSTLAATIIATIPTNTVQSSLYRVRIVSTIPSGSGSDNGANITINASRPTINVKGTKRILCAGSSETFTATISGGGTNPFYQWKKNGVNVGTNINTYTDNALINGDIITCFLTSNAICPIPAILASNSYYVNMSAIPGVTITGNTCSGDTIKVTSSLVPSKIQFYKNGSLTSTATSSFATAATTKAGGNGFGSSANQLASPSGVFIDDNGVVYVADRYNHRVQKFTTASTIGVTVAGGAGSGSNANQLNTPTSVFVDRAGNLYVSESGNNRVTRWNVGATTGVVVAGGNGSGTKDNQLNGPHTVFVDNGQNVYVSDQFNNRIQKWTAGATTGVTVAGNNGSGAAANQLNVPQGIYLDNDNNLYIADQGNNRIQKWNVGATSGITVAGGNGSGAAANQLSFPVGVYVDINNNIFITDYFNARVQKWAAGFSVGTTVAGGNGSGAAANQLSGPIAITIGKDGAMYVVEDFNNRVQKFVHTISSNLTNTQAGTYTAIVTSANNCTATTAPFTVFQSRIPTIIINASQSTLCSATPTNVSFSSIITNGGLSPMYQWKKNGVNVGTSIATYSDNALANGDIITCVLTSNDTCISAANVTSNSISITVNTTVTPSISIAALQTVLCSGSTFSFAATPTNGGTNPSYQWRVNGGNVGTNSSNFSSNSLVNGDVVSCIVTSNAVCNTGVATSNLITLVVMPTVMPTITINPSQNNICTGSSVTFSATVTNAGTTPIYQWKKNGANVFTGTTYTSNTLVNGDTISCLLTSNAACNLGVVMSNKVGMIINPNVIPQISIATPTLNVCDGFNVIFTATTTNGGAAPMYQWRKNGLDVGTSDTSYTDNALVNGDAINCSLVSNANCLSFSNAVSNLVTVTVNPNLVPSVAIVASQTNICSGTLVTFTANATNTGAAPIYQWKKNSVNVGTNSATFTSSTLTNSDTISCTMISNVLCGSPLNVSSNKVIISVITTVTPTVSISTPLLSICSGTTTTFTATATNGGTSPSYQWFVNGSLAGTDSVKFSSNTLTNGSIVSCVVTSNALCPSVATANSNTLSMTVATTVTPSITITSSVTPNLCSATTSITFFSNVVGGGTTPAFQWRRNGILVGTLSTFTRASWVTGDTITCTLVSNAICKTATSAISNKITIVVNTPVVPTISINTPIRTVCSGLPITFTATATNVGSSPQYFWRINGSTVLVTSANTFTTSTLANGNIVSCILTSNAVCATPTSVLSNNITMIVNTTVTPTISIATPQTSICVGSSVTFTATATNGGATPIYQWQKNGTNVGTNATTYTDNSLANGDIIGCIFTSNALCATLNIINSNAVTMGVTTINPPIVATPINIGCGQNATLNSTGGILDSVRWFNAITGGSSFATAFTTTVTPTTTTTYFAESFNATFAGTPRVNTIATAGATIIDHNAITNDDRGGLALSNNFVYIVGDGATGRFNRSDLTGGTALPLRDGFFGDLTNGNLWQLGNTTTAGAGFQGGIISNLFRLDENLTLTGTSIALSQSINTGSGNIVAAGFGFLLYHNGSNTYHINLSTGLVTTLPFVGLIQATGSESWANYGWGEFDGTDYSICYTQNNTTIVKRNLTTGVVSVIQAFTNLSDMAACVFDADNNRLYFHHENSSQFGGSGETLGFVATIKTASPASCSSVRVPVVVNVSYNTPTIAIAASQITICSGNNVVFTATTTFAGTNPIYQWQLNGNNVGTNSSTYANNILDDGDIVTCSLVSSATCLTSQNASSNSLTITVDGNVVPVVTIAASQLPICNGTATTFTATVENGGTAPSFVWRKNGVVVGTNSPIFTTNVLAAGNTITCTITSNALCLITATALSNAITITVATPLTASVAIAASASIICPGTTITYTATPTNGGTNPSYQWQLNGANVGINTNTFSSSTLQDGDVVMCNMTSNSTSCLVARTVISNLITVNYYTTSLIKTIAGNGISGFSGDGGLASSASIAQPFGIVKDASGNIYFSDFANNRIRKISTTGIITTIAGNGTASSTGDAGQAALATLNGPRGIALDAAGNIFVVETFGNKIRKINKLTGIITTVVGTGIQGFLGDGGLATNARLNTPESIAFNSAGVLYISDANNMRIRRVVLGGTITTVAGTGAASTTGDGGAATLAAINYPLGLAFDATGNLYVSEFFGHRVRKISTTNIITTIAGSGLQGFGGDNGLATVANLNNPFGLAFDAQSNLLIADESNNRIRKVNSVGIISTIVGNAGGGFNGDYIDPTTATLSLPTTIMMDANNNLFIGENANNRIRKVTQNTVASTIPTITATPTAICLGASSTLSIATGTLNGAANWKWYNGGCGSSLVGTGNSILVSPTTATTYYVRGEGGCTPSATPNSCGIVTVGLTGTVPTISISTPVIIICSGATVTFTATIANGGTTPIYQWKKNGTNVGTNAATFSSNTLLSGDIISCVLTSNLTGCLAANNVTSNYITVYYAGAATVATIAGTGSFTISGDGGLATAASIGAASSMAKDKIGNIYFSALSSNTIRKISPNGIITAFAGTGTASSTGDGGPALLATFSNILGLTIDSIGNVYATEAGGNRIRKIATNGIVSTFVGTGVGGFFGDGTLATNARINTPYGLCFDKKGNLYFADLNNNRIRKVNTAGIITTVAGYGVSGFEGDGVLATGTALSSPIDVKIDTAGNIIINDYNNSRIRKILSSTGIISTIVGNGVAGFGGDGGAATSAQISSVSAISVDVNNNLYFSDGNNNRIRVVDNSGIIKTIVGNGNTGYNGDGLDPLATSISAPANLIADSIGVVYFADLQNARIRKLTPSLGLPTINLLTASASNICSGTAVTLNVASGVLNAAANWKWYSGTCGGTAIATGASTSVNPTATTTYFARGEGGCITSPVACTPITIYVTPTITPVVNVVASKNNICIGALDSFKASVVGAGTCYPGWSYRKPIVITNNNATSLTDFQVKININTASLIASGKMLATGADIRFNDSACAALPYTIDDSINTSNTSIWVKVNSLAANSNKTIYLYYGNATAIAGSSPDSTFMLYDDFNGTTLNTSKWNSFGDPISVSGGTINFVTIGSSSSTIRSTRALPKPYLSEIKVTASSGSWPSLGQLNQGTFTGVGMFQQTGGNTHINSFNAFGSSYSSFFSSDIFGGNVGIWSMLWVAQNNFTANWLTNSITKTTSQVGDIPSDSLHTAMGLLNSGAGTMTIDWFRARKFAAITPTANITLPEAINAYSGTYNFTINSVSVQNTSASLLVSTTINNNDTVACTISALNSCSTPTISNKVVVKVVSPVAITTNVNGCNSVVYKTITYTASTILRDTLKSVLGCDSIFNRTNINVTTIVPTTQNVTLSACNSLVYKTKTYTTSTVIRDTTKSFQGCDSIYSNVNIVITTVIATTNNIVLKACNSLVYKGNTYTNSALVKDTIKSTQGCDSIYNNATITILNVVTTTKLDSAFGCNSVIYKSKTYTSSTIVRDTIKTNFGCDSIYNIAKINVNTIVPTTQNVTLSACNSLVYKTKTYTTSTVIRDTTKSFQGCDSIYSNVNIVITTVIATTNNIVLKACNSLVYKGNTYTNSALVKDTIKSTQGCDSIYNNATITILNVVTTTKLDSAFGCNSVIYKSKTYTNSTIVRDTIKTNFGCDSIYNIAKINVTITPIISLLNYNAIVYLGDTLQLNVVASDAISYLWTGPASFTSTANMPKIINVTLANAGKYYVTAINGNCTIKDSVTVFISSDIIALKGRVISPMNSPVLNVNLNVTGTATNSFLSNAAGNYLINHLAIGNYTVKPKKNNDIIKNNGVSSIDMVLTTRHILGLQPFNSAYKIIAADVNNNKTVTNIDIIFMKRLILGLDTTFTGNRLWAFVDSAYSFPDTTNPFPYKDTMSYINLTSNKTNQTFIGVKLGDVNYDWNASVARTSLVDNIELLVTDKLLSVVDKQINMPITVKNFKDLTAIQYTLNFDNSKYEFVAITNNKLGIDFNATQANKTGNITMLWIGAKGEPTTLKDGSELFTLVLRAKAITSNEDINNLQLSINNSITDIEAWDNNNLQHNIVLKQINKPTNQPIYNWSVGPNPSNGNIVVSLKASTNKKITLRLTDAQSKTLFTQTVEAIAGSNNYKINLNKNGKLPTGVYFIKAIGMEGEYVKKILIVE
jgi:sugar lactone lactonase YvrE